ncbi:MAG: hypothetical protein LBI05_09320 [Planctomycetaceae bacterium]|jgi:hypothetical protein|nr:hypothetical protein [Planctomycetaceae bacterium]
MRAVSTFVSGLFLSALLFLPNAVCAAELKPFLTLKTANVNTLIGVAEKIGSMTGGADSAEFQAFIKTAKNLKGFDLKGIAGIALVVDDNNGLVPLLLLPITDLGKAEIPDYPDIFDSIRPFLVKSGNDYVINTPFGSYVAAQKKDYLVITPESIADQVPSDPKKLFADLDKFTFGIKLDLEKVEFEPIEGNIFGPLMFLAMTQAPEAAEQIGTAIEFAQEVHKEFAVFSGGLTFNAQTADVELSGTITPRRRSDVGKMLAGTKKQPTRFNGFRGTQEETIYSFGDSFTMPPVPEQNVLMGAKGRFQQQQWDTILDGFLEQIEMDDDSGKIAELAKNAVDSLKKIFAAESARGAMDFAGSLNTDGAVLFAFDTVSLAEIQKAAALILDFASEKYNIDINSLVKQDDETIEGFKVSSIKIPIERVPLISNAGGIRNLTPGVFWAVKEASGKQMITVAAGLDFDKTEQAFKSALEKTKTSVSVQKPEGVLSVQALGKFLQQTVSPVAEAANVPNMAEAKRVFAVLASAGNDATVTETWDVKAGKMDVSYRISGKALQAFIAVIKLAAESMPNSPAIQDF